MSSTLSKRLAALEQATEETPGALPDGNPFDGSMTAEEITAFLEKFI